MNVAALIVGILLLLAGGVVLVFLPTAFNAQKNTVAENRSFNQILAQWPTVTGTVIESRHAPWRRDNDDCGASVDFRYQVHGLNYVGKQAWRSCDSKNSMRKRRISEDGPEVYWAKGYPSGKAVSVHYNPTNPAEAFVDFDEAARSTGGTWFVAVVLVLLAIFLVCAALVFFVGAYKGESLRKINRY